MVEKSVTFAERLFFMMIWVIIVLALAGLAIHYAHAKGFLPGFIEKGLRYTNLSDQAGGN